MGALHAVDEHRPLPPRRIVDFEDGGLEDLDVTGRGGASTAAPGFGDDCILCRCHDTDHLFMGPLILSLPPFTIVTAGRIGYHFTRFKVRRPVGRRDRCINLGY